MNLKACEYLLAIADKGSLSAAARHLKISQPTLSGFLTNTEKELGQALFERSGRHMLPTPSGQIYLTACQEMLETKNQTYYAISSISNTFTERLRLGVTPFRGIRVFSRVFSDFYRRFPNVEITTVEGYMTDLKEKVLNGGVDLAMGTGSYDEMDRLSFACQCKENLLLCVPDYHPLSGLGRAEPPFPIADIRRFQDTPFIMWGDGTNNQILVRNYLESHHMQPTVVYECNNALQIDIMLQTGMGIGFLPQSFCKPGQRRVYFRTKPAMVSIVGVFSHPEHALTKPERYLIYLIARLQYMEEQSGQVFENELMKSIMAEFEEENYGH